MWRMVIRNVGPDSFDAVKSYLDTFNCRSVTYEMSSDGLVLTFQDETDLRIAKQTFGALLEELHDKSSEGGLRPATARFGQ